MPTLATHLGGVAVDVHEEKWHGADLEVDGVGFGILRNNQGGDISPKVDRLG